MKKKNIFLSLLIVLSSLVLSSCKVDYTAYEEAHGIANDALTITFLELGNKNSGDAILIQNSEYDILVDAGSKTTSFSTLKSYIDEHVQDKKLEYVFVTHAHEDHYANFAGTGSEESSLFYHYEVENIIQFARTNQNEETATGNLTMYGKYLHMRDLEVANGAKLCTGYDSYNNLNGCVREINLNSNTKISILNNYYYDHSSSGENNFSVCFLLTHYEHKFLFTGDLEEEGEAKLIELNELPEVDLFKAGHHGSKTSSSATLLDVIKPKNVVITCVAGSVEYTTNLDNTFPTKKALETIANYTDKVYVTTQGTIRYDETKEKYVDDSFSSLNGNITVTSTQNNLTIHGSNNDTILKNSEWYTNYYRDYRNSEYPWN